MTMTMMMMMLMMTITSAVFVTFFALAILTPVSGAAVCVKPDPLVRRITEKDGAGTNVFISRGVVSASYTFLFEAQSNFSETYFDKFFEYRHTGDTWVLQLTRALDLDLIARGSSQGLMLSAKIFCTADKEQTNEIDITDTNVTDMDKSPSVENRSVVIGTQPKETYLRMVHVRNVDEFDPAFSDQRVFTVREDAPVDYVVVRIGYLFSDKDFSGQASIVQYFAPIKYEGNLVDGQGVFDVTREGDTILKRPLDFEKGDKVFGLGVVGHDFGGRSAKTVLELHVINLNDNPPIFVNTGCIINCNDTYYYAIISSFYTGSLTKFPTYPIHAEDADGDAIEYSLLTGIPMDYEGHVTIDKNTGVLNITKHLMTLGSLDHVNIMIQAVSVSNLTKPRGRPVSDVALTSVQLWLTHEIAAHSISVGRRTEPAHGYIRLLETLVLIYLALLR